MSAMIATPLSVEWSLLGFLRQQPMHGYEIAQRLSNPEGIGLVWRLKQSHVYALLAKMEARQYITHTLQAEGVRSRKVYHVTERGTKAFLEWLHYPVAHAREMRLEFLAKLYFATLEGPTHAAHLIDVQREFLQQWVAEQRSLAEPMRKANAYEWLVHQFRIGQMEAMLSWLELCKRTLPSKPC